MECGRKGTARDDEPSDCGADGRQSRRQGQTSRTPKAAKCRSLSEQMDKALTAPYWLVWCGHTDGYGTVVASKQKLLDAAIDVIRKKGYAATRVDDIAAYAGVTKGSFFHHFSSKEECARAAAARWREQAEVAFSQSGYRDAPSPAARVLAYLDFRIRILEGPVESYACYAGTLLQEVHLTCPALAADCAEVIFNHAQSLEFDLAAALGPDACEASDLAFHIQATIQGALLMAKAEGHGRGARKSLEYLQQYLAIRMGENPR